MIEDYNEYRLAKREKIIFLSELVVFLAAAGYVFYAGIFPAAAAPLLYPKAEKIYRGWLARRRKNVLLVQFRDFLYSLSASFASGRHMAEAMEEACENLTEIYGADSVLVSELLAMLKKMKETGDTDISVWADFSARCHLEDIGDFTAVYAACRETGGNLVAAVNKAASVIGEKITIENEIRTMAAQKKLEGRIITAMPVIIILFLQMMSPEYLEIMYTSLAGRLLMTAALAMAAGAYVVIERITQIEV